MQATSTQPGRQGHRWRCLRESRVEVDVDLDRRGPIDVVTDLDDLSEAIAAIASGGGFALRLYSEGGPCADVRLVAEDCGYELGAALREALCGAARSRRVRQVVTIGTATVEAELEFVGRPEATFDAGQRPGAGLTSTAVWLPAFFQAFALSLGVRLEVRSRGPFGPDVVAACFRGVGAAIGLVAQVAPATPES